MKDAAWLLIIVGLFFAGCAAPAAREAVVFHEVIPEEELADATISITDSMPAAEHCIAGTSVEGRTIECIAMGEGEDVILIIAAIHGDEPAGAALAEKLAEHLQENPNLLEGRKVVVVPMVNPDGMARYSRFNANGVDLNRNFTADNRINEAEFGFGPLSEPESRIIYELIEKYFPNRIVSCHQPANSGTGWVDYDGPGEDLANRMAEYSQLPVRKLGALPGSLGAYAGETLGIAIITFEQPINVDGLDSEQIWERYGAALVAAVVYPE